MACDDDNYEAWKELKLQYDFTAKYVHTAAKAVFGFGKVCDYAFDILFLLIATWGALHNWILLLIALLPAIVLFTVKVVIYRRTAKILHLPRLFFALPLFSLVQPWVNLYFNIIGSASRKKNFTWR